MKSVAIVVMGALLGSGCGESREKVRNLETELERTQTQLAAAKVQVTTLQSQLTVANAKIAEQAPVVKKARTLPLRVTSHRPSPDTNSVYQIQNLSGTALAVKIKLSNPTYQHSQSATSVLPASRPAPPYEIGPAQGWPAAPGDVLEITSEGYDVMTKTF